VRIGFYLSIHGIRRVKAFQVIDVVHSKVCILRGLAASYGVHAMLRSVDVSCSLNFAPKITLLSTTPLRFLGRG